MRSDIDAQKNRIKVQEEQGFITIDGTCISWGSANMSAGGPYHIFHDVFSLLFDS